MKKFSQRSWMCGRYTLLDDSETIAKIFGYKVQDAMPPRYNIAPSQDILIVRIGEDGNGEIIKLRWGLIPRWVIDPAKMPKPINAQSETAAEKPYFRLAFKRNRCLIPTNGYYEWQHLGKLKQPYFIHMPQNALFFFAGLWEYWVSLDGEVLETATILTTSANAAVSVFHDRMPVILSADSYKMWLDKHNQDVKQLSAVMKPYEGNNLQFYPVSTLVNSARNEFPDCIEPLEEPKLL